MSYLPVISILGGSCGFESW